MRLMEKIAQAEEVLKLAAEMSELYYQKPLIITYSGGKDSDVMLDIALMCLRPDQFEVLNSHTTVDAPETVYYIRDKFKKLNEMGVKTEVRMPRYKGEPTSMWKLIVDKESIPTRLMRFCCEILKEASTPNRIIAVGVREDESAGRKGRDAFLLREKKENVKYMSKNHIREQFESSKQITTELGDAPNKPNAYDCKFIEGVKKNKDAICNPIYKFTDQDIWDYIHFKGLKVNPLYSRGYKRVGCIGCPLAGAKHQKKEFADYPKYRENYVKAFDRMLEKRKKKGKSFINCQNGEEIMRWWLQEDPKQVRIEDILPDKQL